MYRKSITNSYLVSLHDALVVFVHHRHHLKLYSPLYVSVSFFCSSVHTFRLFAILTTNKLTIKTLGSVHFLWSTLLIIVCPHLAVTSTEDE